MTFKKFALITALLITSITAAAAGPTASHYQDRAADVGENVVSDRGCARSRSPSCSTPSSRLPRPGASRGAAAEPPPNR